MTAESNREHRLRTQGASGRVRHADELLAEAARLDRRADHEVVRIAVDADVAEHMRKFRVADVDLAPADAEAKIRATLDARFDDELARDVRQFGADFAATVADLERRVADSRQAPKVDNDLRELVLYRRFEGRTLADVARAYAATGDADDPVFMRMVESDAADLARALRLRSDDGDVAALQRLQEAIHARQDARQDQHATGALEALRAWRGRMTRITDLLRRAETDPAFVPTVARLRRSR